MMLTFTQKRLWGILFLSGILTGSALNAGVTDDPPFSGDELAVITKNILANIAVDKSIQGIANQDPDQPVNSMPGAVLASPSSMQIGSFKARNISKYTGFNQDYIYHWVRDSAITMDSLITLYEKVPSQFLTMEAYFKNYVAWVSHIKDEKSTNTKYGAPVQMLGEPKFNIDGTVYNKDWGRPQNDGPALRALTLIHLRNVTGEKYDTQLYQTTTGLINRDLNYIASLYEDGGWTGPHFGVWEAMDGRHFFNEIVQVKALIEGYRINPDTSEASKWLGAASKITGYFQDHLKRWPDPNPTDMLYNEMTDDHGAGYGLDSTVLFGVLYGDTSGLQVPVGVPTPTTPAVMFTMYHLRDTFTNPNASQGDYYTINGTDKTKGIGPLIGRYPGDSYDALGGTQEHKGNPWVLSTCLFAQYYYTLVYELADVSEFIINEKVMDPYGSTFPLRFFTQAADVTQNQTLANLKNGTYSDSSTPSKKEILDGLITAGDAMLKAVKIHNPDLNMFEQMNRDSGFQASAASLTWSYATVLSSMNARDKAVIAVGKLK